jgi:transcriptional regulator with XRE-family HTH domain
MLSVGQHLRFSEWLQSQLDGRGWSQSDCARAANLNRAVINKLLNGKTKPHPSTLSAIARAFKIPIETVYRAAGYLPPGADGDDAIEELVHVYKSIQSQQRRATAIRLLKALATEEENEQRNVGKGKR